MIDRVRVFVVHSHAIVRLGVIAVLDTVSDIACVGSAHDVPAALAAAGTAEADVLLVQHPPHDADGALAAWRARRASPVGLVVLSDSPAEAAHASAGRADGADAALHVGISPATLSAALRAAAPRQAARAREGAGTTAAPGPVATSALAGLAASPGSALTQRERELLSLMGRGLSNQQISTELRIAMPTVKYHVTNILSKLGADNRTAAVLMALKHGLVFLE